MIASIGLMAEQHCVCVRAVVSNNFHHFQLASIWLLCLLCNAALVRSMDQFIWDIYLFIIYLLLCATTISPFCALSVDILFLFFIISKHPFGEMSHTHIHTRLSFVLVLISFDKEDSLIEQNWWTDHLFRSGWHTFSTQGPNACHCIQSILLINAHSIAQSSSIICP